MTPHDRFCAMRDIIDTLLLDTRTSRYTAGLRELKQHIEKLLDPTVTEQRAALDEASRAAVEKYRVNAFLLLLRLVGGSFVFTDGEMETMRGHVVSYQRTPQGNRFELEKLQ